MKQTSAVIEISKNGRESDKEAIKPPMIGPMICPMPLYEALIPWILPCDFSSVSVEIIVCESAMTNELARANNSPKKTKSGTFLKTNMPKNEIAATKKV